MKASRHNLAEVQAELTETINKKNTEIREVTAAMDRQIKLANEKSAEFQKIMNDQMEMKVEDGIKRAMRKHAATSNVQ